jgi:hypothetical protein
MDEITFRRGNWNLGFAINDALGISSLGLLQFTVSII